MTLFITPEIGVPFSDEVPYEDLRDKAEAACNTALELSEYGLDVEPNKDDKDTAAKLAAAYAEDPAKTSKKATTKKISTLTPASIILTNNILQEFGHSVAENATQLRHLVTNKLLLESENDDPRIRIRALELLGKISDVGLFAEKTEVTVTHQSTDDLRNKLRSKLEKLVEPIEYAEDAVILDGEAIDLEEILGPEEYDD
jgi:hypothetical protein